MKEPKTTLDDRKEMARLRVEEHLAYQVIAARFKDCDGKPLHHTTVLYHIRRITGRRTIPKVNPVSTKQEAGLPRESRPLKTYNDYLNDDLRKRRKQITAQEYLRKYY